MDTIQLIRDGLSGGSRMMDQFIADIPDARMAEQFGPVVNHPAWTTGHLAVTMFGLANVLGDENHTPEGWREKFGMGSIPTNRRDDYASKEELVAQLNKAVGAVEQKLVQIDETKMDEKLPIEPLRKIFPTVGHFAAGLCGAHCAYHQGQLSVWRKAAGLPNAFPV